ncbi:hypothetical protein V2B37_05725 [Natranaerobius thermophilus JW/NM-WN-LF]|uniref:Uncharacterized protein n=2 Tax=Natranaerobius TaxID=375928 RepID=B2A108_NATTJ|nr:hypothetical protein Nther_1047 [Natranaerobius thermophilus JW/NM-WN-LF]
MLNLSAEFYLEGQRASDHLDYSGVIRSHIFRVMCGFIIGASVNWRKVKGYFEGNINFGIQLLPGILILGISLLPTIWISENFGVLQPFGDRLIDWLFAPLQWGVESNDFEWACRGTRYKRII